MGHIFLMYCVHKQAAAAVAAAAALGWWHLRHEQKQEQDVKQERQNESGCCEREGDQHRPASKQSNAAPLPTGVIYQSPPPDYDTRIPMSRPLSHLPAALRTSVATHLLLRNSPSPPSVLGAAGPSALCIRPSPGLLEPSTYDVLGGQGGRATFARHLALKLLASAATTALVLLAATGYSGPLLPAALKQRMHHNQQQQQQQHAQMAIAGSAMTAAHPGSLSSTDILSAADAAALSAAAHIGAKQKQYTAWVRQRLPSVLQAKRAELHELQQLQETVSCMAHGLSGAGPELEAVLGSAQDCLQEQIDSLQVHLEALEGELAR